jgi:hypothetical protein
MMHLHRGDGRVPPYSEGGQVRGANGTRRP